jgi:Nuclease-related domain
VTIEVDYLMPLIVGCLLGALCAGYTILLDCPPAYIENWRTGSEGERRTARALAPLRKRGYALLHDLPDRGTGEHGGSSNIDHVVVCAGGVFLLDSKQLGGDASIDADNVHVQRHDDDASYDLRLLARRMRGRALRLKQDISQQTDIAFVQPVVVFWNPFPAGVVIGENIAFMHGDRLRGWLEAQPTKLTPDAITSVAAAIVAARPAERRDWRGRLTGLHPTTAS